MEVSQKVREVGIVIIWLGGFILMGLLSKTTPPTFAVLDFFFGAAMGMTFFGWIPCLFVTIAWLWLTDPKPPKH